MDAGVHITSAACGGAYAEEQESGHAHAQQDGEEELGSTGRVHGCCRAPRGAVEAFCRRWSLRRLSGGQLFSGGCWCDADAYGDLRALLEKRITSSRRFRVCEASVDGHTSF